MSQGFFYESLFAFGPSLLLLKPGCTLNDGKCSCRQEQQFFSFTHASIAFVRCTKFLMDYVYRKRWKCSKLVCNDGLCSLLDHTSVPFRAKVAKLSHNQVTLPYQTVCYIRTYIQLLCPLAYGPRFSHFLQIKQTYTTKNLLGYDTQV